ncbi:MAG TPA: TIM barrel protein [Desulfobacterales bacterium]
MALKNFQPVLALCNFIADLHRLKNLALEHGFAGIDWSFDMEHLPNGPAAESRWADLMAGLEPLELRYHCPFMKVDIGHENPAVTRNAVRLFQRVIKLVSKAGGRYLTLHIGLGHDTTRILSWNETIANLRMMVHYGAERGVKVCLENLAWGWTSKPNLFEKLVRRSGAGVTFDIGHAHACEAVASQLFEARDFVSPHPGRVHNAHVYFTELSGVGHLPPESLEDIRDRLEILWQVQCAWWTLEIKDVQGLLQTKACVDQYLAGLNRS